MKKTSLYILTFFMILATFTGFTGCDKTSLSFLMGEVSEAANDEPITIYCADGREACIYRSELDTYLKLGWYENKEDVIRTLYSTDGREITVYLNEIALYNNLGWYQNKEDVTSVLYSADGRELVVFLDEVPLYTGLGWHQNKADVTRTLYSTDGRELTIFISEVPTYTALGWFENKSDVTRTLYAPDGREILVYIDDTASYTALGWYESKDDVVTTLYSSDGREITVYNAEVEAYLALGWRRTPGRAVDPSKPMVALTFDDGPRPQSTNRILNTLEAYDACATFFVVGYLAAENASILQRMDALGCQIGNHTYNHPDLSGLSSSSILTQISSTDNAVYNATGKIPTVIRPPYGSLNSNVKLTCDRPLILWSIDTNDWKSRYAPSVVTAALSGVKDGDIILMHDLYDSTATAVETIVPELIARGFQLVTVDELSYYKNKPLSAHNSYSSIR